MYTYTININELCKIATIMVYDSGDNVVFRNSVTLTDETTDKLVKSILLKTASDVLSVSLDKLTVK